MPRPVGLPKSGGRKKGTPNCRSRVLPELVTALGLDVPAQLVEILPTLRPEKQADVLLGLLGFLYPKRKAIDFAETEAPRSMHAQIVEFIERVESENPPNLPTPIQFHRTLR